MTRTEGTFRDPIRCMRVLAVAAAFVLVASVASAQTGFQVPGMKECTLLGNQISCDFTFTNTSQAGRIAVFDSLTETIPCNGMIGSGNPVRIICPGANSGTPVALQCINPTTLLAVTQLGTDITDNTCNGTVLFDIPPGLCGTTSVVPDLIALDFHLAADSTVRGFSDVTGTAELTFPPCEGSSDRITGGGSVFVGSQRVTHGFELHCDIEIAPNNLEVNWSGNHFHMEELTSADCTDDPTIDPKPPKDTVNDTYTGTGTGRCNGVAGATISFVFTDAGEPGKKDTAVIDISCPAGAGTSGISVPETNLKKGNHQFHLGTGSKQ